MAGGHVHSWFSSQAFLSVANVVYVMLAMSLLTLAGCLPLMLCLVLGVGVNQYPMLLLGVVCSAPGLAASFAVFRSHPLVVPEARRQAFAALRDGDGGLPEWIAPAYVPDDAEVAVFRPFARAYARIAVRAWLVAAVFGVFEFLVLYDAQLLMQVGLGVVVIPLLLVVALLGVQAMLVALVLCVEFPKARWMSVVRNGLICSARRFWMTLGNLLCLGVYACGVRLSPVPVAILATGVVAFVLWSGARWQVQPLALAMARESENPLVVECYQA